MPPVEEPVKVSNPNANGMFEIEGLKFWALGDRVLIIEDEFKTGYECSVCSGAGKASCGDCDGRGMHLRGGVGVKCSHCDSGSVTCPECKGKGGLLIAPETSQRRPTTGLIASCGGDCKVLTPGQSVMYSNYAGYAIDLTRSGRNICVRILHETEVLCAMEGHLNLRNNAKGKNEITQFNA